MALKEILMGKSSRNTIERQVVPLMFIVYIGFMFISWLFDLDFNWLTMYISNLGNPYSNPIGWIPWSIGHGLLAVFLLTVVSYIKNHLPSEGGKFVKMACKLMYLGPIGLVGLAVVPQFEGIAIYIIHLINAAFFLLGEYLALWLITLHYAKEKAFGTKRLILALWSFMLPICALIFLVLRLILVPFGSAAPFYLDIPFWEWLIVFNALFALSWLAIVLPEKDLKS